MPSKENSYQTARRDAFRAAAIVGAGAAGYWGYKKVKKAWSNDDGEWVLWLVGAIGLIFTSPLLLLLYGIYYRNCMKRESKRLAKFNARHSELATQSELLERRVVHLPAEDRSEARLETIEPVRRRITRLERRRLRSAELLASRILAKRHSLEAQRRSILRRIEDEEPAQLQSHLNANSGEIERIDDMLTELEESYGALPYESFLGAVVVNHKLLLTLAILVGFGAFLTLIFPRGL